MGHSTLSDGPGTLKASSEFRTSLGGLQVIPGKEDACISCLAWVKDPVDGTEALVSGGLDGVITEWDLLAKVPKHVGDSFGGAVWDIAVEPDSQTEQGAEPQPQKPLYACLCTLMHWRTVY